jgi:magnesium transporter
MMNRKDFEALIQQSQWPTLRELFKEMSDQEVAQLLLELGKEERSELLQAMPQQLFVAREEIVKMQRQEVRKLIERGEWTELRQILSEWPFPEVADLLLEQDKPGRVLLFRSLKREQAADVFAYLEPETQNGLLKELTDDETRSLLADMDPDDRTELLSELPGQATQKLLNLLPEEDLREARWLLGYPEDSVGRLMTPDYVAVRPHWTVGEALEHVRRLGIDRESVNWIYVTDDSWNLLDALPLRNFVFSDPERKVEELMDHSFVSVSAFDDREEAVQTIRRYDLEAVPVVDTEGVLVGIVTVDDVLDVAQEEATEDIHLASAIAPAVTSYRETGVWGLFRRRVVWLVALVIVNLLSSGVIAAYEETLAAAIALAFFIPLLIDSGGNTGSQSATLMVRSIAIGDVQLSQWLRVVSKELLVGITLGIALGLAASVLGVFRGGPEIGLIVGLTMVCIVIVANMIGTILPFVLTRIGLDPAVASAPLITSIADATGLLIYFSIATAILTIV